MKKIPAAQESGRDFFRNFLEKIHVRQRELQRQPALQRQRQRGERAGRREKDAVKVRQGIGELRGLVRFAGARFAVFDFQRDGRGLPLYGDDDAALRQWELAALEAQQHVQHAREAIEAEQIVGLNAAGLAQQV